MHLLHIPQCTNGALWDIEQVHCGICEIALSSGLSVVVHVPVIWRFHLSYPLTDQRCEQPSSIAEKISYCKIALSFGTSRFVFKIFQSPWNLTVSHTPVKFQSDTVIWTVNIDASRIQNSRDLTLGHLIGSGGLFCFVLFFVRLFVYFLIWISS